MSVKLTPAQLVTLAHIQRHYALGVSWQEACESGNRAPVYVRLHYLGLITDPPFRVTEAGNAILKTVK
jgi:hypothetical protein